MSNQAAMQWEMTLMSSTHDEQAMYIVCLLGSQKGFAQMMRLGDALSLAFEPWSSKIMVIPWSFTLCLISVACLWAQNMSCHVDLQTASCTLVTIPDLTFHLQAEKQCQHNPRCRR